MTREEINVFWREIEELSQALRELWISATVDSEADFNKTVDRLNTALGESPALDLIAPSATTSPTSPGLKRKKGYVVPSKAAKRHIETSQRIIKEDYYDDCTVCGTYAELRAGVCHDCYQMI